MEEQQETRSTARRIVQKFGFMLCLLLVVVGIMFNVLDMVSMSASYYYSNVPKYLSTFALCLAVIVGLLAVMTTE
ncbi:MAG: hypothetical protein PVH12_07900 [Candidatus Bathyarchaeota archaeon]